jgi:hypothetical protein
MSAIKEHYHNEICEGQLDADKDKRFLAFAFDAYDACGGLGDLQGSYDTLDAAINALRNDRHDHKELYDRIAGIMIDIDLYGL